MDRRIGKKTAVLCLVAVLVGAMALSGHMLLRADRQYQQENLYHQVLLSYKPQVVEEGGAANTSLMELQTLYPDVVGWLSIPGTQIDYPFVQGRDNDEYLHADLDHAEIASGTLFMDYRAATDMTSFNSVIYGHHMKNESMFGSLPQLRKKDTFERYTSGTLSLPYANYDLEIFAVLLIDRYDATIYNCLQETVEEKQAFLDYVRDNADQYRDIGAAPQDSFVTLSTCSYEFTDARTVVICRLGK